MDEFISQLVSLARANVLAAIAVGVLFLYILYRKPRLVIGVLVLGALLFSVNSLISDASSAGTKQKQKMIRNY